MADPDARSTDVYTTDEVDGMFAVRDARLDDHDERLEVLELGGTTPPVEPPTEPPPEGEHGVDLTLTFVPPELVAGKPAVLAAAITNRGDTGVPVGTIIGVGFYVGEVGDAVSDGESVTYASTDVGLAAGASVHLDTASAPMHGPNWTPADAGAVALTAFVDDLDRIPEYDETTASNQVTRNVVVADRPPPPEPGAVVRPFADDSLWNTLKAPQVFAAGADGLLRSRGFGLNNGAYGHPLTWSTDADPTHHVNTPDSWGWPPQRLAIHMRDDAVPASGTDGHLSVANTESGQGADFWQMHKTGDREWSCAAYALYDVWGPGWGQASPFQSAGVTAAGAPTLAGTITAAEVEAGVLEHALCIAFAYGDQGGNNTCWTPQLWPAISNDVGGGQGPIAEGALLMATGEMPGGLNEFERLVWSAAQRYGVWCVDKLDGEPMFYGDGSQTVADACSYQGMSTIGRSLRMVQTW